MKIAIDTHTHTLASGHAYNTIGEMAAMAAAKGLEGLAITEHAPEMPGSCHSFYFQNLKVVPKHMCGIEVLMGVELNIMNEKGEVDLPEGLIRQLDIAIASMHMPCYGESRGVEENTKAYLNAMEQECVDIIGHPDDGRYAVDYEALVEGAKTTGTILEINNSSLRPGAFRMDAYENDVQMLRLCKKYKAMITLGSDSHVDIDIGGFAYAEKVLRETEFPEELIANTSMKKLKSLLKRNR